MKRILIGLVVAAVLAAGGWFGFNLYVQHRATAEVEAAFEQIRKQGGKASHGKVAFDLMSRTVTVDDIVVTPGGESQAQIKIAGIKGTGVRLVDENRFSADSIDLAGLELALGEIGPAKVKGSYRVPQLTMRDYAGPLHTPNVPAGASPIEMYRYALEQYASVTASSVAIPTLTFAFDGGSAAAGSGEFSYSGLAIQNLKQGRIGAMKADRANFTINVQQASRADKLTGELSTIAVNDIDVTALTTALDPQKAGDDSYHRIYGQISTGPYVATSTLGIRMQVDGISIDEIALQPSKFRIADVLAALPASDRSSLPTPAQSRELMEKLAALYEGIRVGRIEIGGLSMTTPQGTPRLRSIKYREGEFAIEGLDAPGPNGQVKMERFALKSFSVANLLHWAAGFTNPGQPPSPDQILALFRVLEGVEIKGVVTPYKNSKLGTIDTLSLNWGQLVGSIPSKASLIAKMVAPIDPTNPTQMPLAAAGIDKLAIDLDLGAAWTESSGAFALAPATIDLGNLARAQARLALANVPRGLFTTDPVQAMRQAEQIETGAIELSLRDSGVVDLIVAQFSRMQNLSRDAARSAIVAMIRAQGEKIAAANLDARVAVDALAGFVATSGQTLTIKLTPLGKVPVLQLMDALNHEPIVALAQFRIEASTGL
ncbi:hypothetical protein [Bradyrhizobium iriomotense]|uniref:hypothetical protein n=1 Tax=Bradyrhizobium iriomotense TaxID=441950 RepID=UPI001B8A4C67|nr:hypothetical protein [Bradyrhizobium iriomotense]MBR0780299.1 hypothetical protein [Bradyrhizobium iriomotense]